MLDLMDSEDKVQAARFVGQETLLSQIGRYQ